LGQSGRIFPSKETLEAANVLVKQDAPWQAELRLRQARWREHLHQPAGEAGGRALGSRLPAGDTTSNFLTPGVASAVAAAKEQPGALISVPRIYDNMLSSQPLSFNLFGELQHDLASAGVVGRALWPDLVDEVESIRFEWSPGRGDSRFLGNRSAFDVALLCRDKTGASTCVGIEVKYHEDMTQDPGAPTNPRYSAVAASSGVFRDPEDHALRALPLRQIWFDHLLALSLVGDDADQFTRCRFVLLAPAINEAAVAVDTLYRRQLQDALTYERKTLEEVIAVIGTVIDAPWVSAFGRRYLASSSAPSEGRSSFRGN
jgi:hypothetical protein